MQLRLNRALVIPNVIPFSLNMPSVKTLTFTVCLSEIAEGAVMPYFIPLAFNTVLAKNRWISLYEK